MSLRWGVLLVLKKVFFVGRFRIHHKHIYPGVLEAVEPVRRAGRGVFFIFLFFLYIYGFIFGICIPFVHPFRICRVGGGACFAMVQNEICEIYLLEMCVRERQREKERERVKEKFFHDIFIKLILNVISPPPFSSLLSAGRMEGERNKRREGGGEGRVVKENDEW